MPMNPERKAELLAALRSDDYKQGAGYLKRGDEFCCLGVATDLAVKAGLGTWRELEGMRNSEFIPAGETVDPGQGECGLLPREVARWLGIEETNPIVEVGDYPTRQRLTVLNDERGYLLSEIADLIEEQL